MKKPKGIVAIDIDNTLTNMQEGVHAYGQNYSVYKTGKLSQVVAIDGDDTDKVFHWTPQFDYTFWNNSLDFMWNISPRPLARETINALRREGYLVYIITARVEKFFGKPKLFTKRWLRKNHIKYDKLFVSVKDKASLCKQLGVTHSIDDAPKYYITANKVGIKTFVMNSFENKEQDEKGVTRVYSFPEFYFHITKKPLFVPHVWKRYLTPEIISKYHSIITKE